MPEFTLVQQLCIWALPVLLAITLHEAAHAYVATLCGDNTAKLQGRLSMNPLRHVDLFGTIFLPLVIGLLTHFSFLIGYAKPVPVHWGRLRHPKRDMALVTLAGPLANFVMAFLWAACFKLALFLHPNTSNAALFLLASARAGMLINIMLALLNLIPIPPLDGSRVVMSLLPPRPAMAYAAIEPYGFLILCLLLFTGVLSALLTPLMDASFQFLTLIFKL